MTVKTTWWYWGRQVKVTVANIQCKEYSQSSRDTWQKLQTELDIGFLSVAVLIEILLIIWTWLKEAPIKLQNMNLQMEDQALSEENHKHFTALLWIYKKVFKFWFVFCFLGYYSVNILYMRLFSLLGSLSNTFSFNHYQIHLALMLGSCRYLA